MIRLENLSVRAGTFLLENVSLEVAQGEYGILMGRTGSGKTTLLLTIAGMLRPSGGRVMWDGRDLYALSSPERAAIRSRQIGFVFQMFHLVPYLTALDNVLLAAANGAGRDDAAQLLERLGLADRMRHRPPIILADEPTGNLDPENAAAVTQQLKEYQQQGGTVIVVSHSEQMDAVADRVVQLDRGRIASTVAAE